MNENCKTKCPKCGNVKIRKYGIKYLKNLKKQIYKCPYCKITFYSDEPVDQYEFNRLVSQIYKNVKPSKRVVQKKLTPYTPKNFGEKKTYPQESWSLYEKACSQEKLMFLRILKDSVEYMNLEYKYKGNGRPPIFYDDIIKSMCIKGFHQYSSWRLESELKIARAMGVIEQIPKRSTLNKYSQDSKITEILHKLYKIIAEPLKEIEVYFSPDATGISNAYGNDRWSKVRHSKSERKKARGYSKLHIISGLKTNVICCAKITKGTAHESPFFKSMLDDTAQIFTPREMPADAGYLSKDNVEAIAKIGAIPFIMGKKNVHVPMKGNPSTWGIMLRLWKNHQMFFAEHYHRRSNVESTFSALKRKFGDFCRCKKLQSQENEILCKIVCFNASVLAEALLTYDLKGGFIASL